MSEKNSHQDSINEAPLTEQQKQSVRAGPRSAPPFKVSSLWKAPEINPLNLKSYTLPIFNLTNRYSIAFHLSWLGFFVAFLSWFAFPPLIPEAIRDDLALTPVDVANSNIVALCATLIVRVVTGPAVDRYGPRYVMAALLLIGAIPSGLAGTANNAGSLFAIRFFIGILGGSFVPCVSWTTAFFDKSIVGTANALVAGWGNMGGGVTFVVMTGLYTSLTKSRGLTEHVAWRAAFAIVPVPILIGVAAATLIFGTDHPAGKWSQRHTTAATAAAIAQGHSFHLSADEKAVIESKSHDKEAGKVSVNAVEEEEADVKNVTSQVDVAVNEAPTFKIFLQVIANPLTWLPAITYMTTFGYELYYDSNFANTLFAVYRTRGGDAGFTQLTAGYYTSIFGFLNLVTRPFGGYLADILYRRFGVAGKKYLSLGCGCAMGLVSIGLGQYIDKHSGAAGTGRIPDLGVLIGLSVLIAIFCEVANGSTFSLTPHCSPFSNGIVSGLVGASGNLGGIFFALVIRYQNFTPGLSYWIVGIVCAAANLIVAFIPAPKN